MVTKASLCPIQAKIQCWMILHLSKGPIIVYPKQHLMWTRVNPRNSDALVIRVKTTKGFSKILLSFQMAHQAKIFKITNSLGKPTIKYSIWIQTLKLGPTRWLFKVLSWTRLRMESNSSRDLEPLKPVQILQASSPKFRITVIELSE